MIWLKRIPHLFLALMFIAFTVVQFNDPDPLLWIAIYGAMAALCGLFAFGKYYFKVMLALAAAYLVYLVLLFPGMMDWFHSSDRSLLFDDIAKMQYPFIEEAREFLGLIICEVVLVIYILIAQKK